MIPSALSDLREQLAVDADGHRLVDLCLQVVIVLDGPLAPAMPRVQRLYDGFMARYADRIRLAYGYDERQMRLFDPDEWRDAARWLDAPLSVGGGSFGARFQAGDPQAEQRPPMFEAVHYAPSPELARVGIRMAFPIDEIGPGEPGGDAWRDRFAGLLHGLPLRIALCGLAPCWSQEHNDSASAFKTRTVPKLQRHPGLDLGAFTFHVLHAPAGVMTIHWLTALGPQLADRLGGAGALRADLPPPCEVVGLPGGAVVLRAGAEPSAGDVNRNDRLPAYQAVARALRPVWASDDYIGNISYPEMEPEVGDAWIARFF